MNPFFKLRLSFQKFWIFFSMIIYFETIMQFQKFYLIRGIHFGICHQQTINSSISIFGIGPLGYTLGLFLQNQITLGDFFD